MKQEVLHLNPEDGQYYRFKRICRLKECEIEFYTNRKEHYFCVSEEKHQQEYWKRKRRGDRALEAEIAKQRKEIDELKEAVGIK